MASSLRSRIRELENQLHAARYAMHKLRDGQYGYAVKVGEISPEHAATRYRLAMANFDDIIKGAPGGAWREAIDREMKEYDPVEAMRSHLVGEVAEGQAAE